MLIRFIRPETIYGRSLYYLLIGYLVVGLSGCSTPPRTEKPPTSVARAMETRSFSGDLKTVLKASINSLQDMDYTIEVLNSDVGLITASRTTENKKAKLASEQSNEGMTDSEKACLTIGAIAVIAVIAAAIFDGDDDDRGGNTIYTGGGNDDGPDGPMIYRYRVTINLTELNNDETNVRVSASGEVEQDGKILSTGGVHEPEFFQKFFAGMNQGLFLDQNQPIKTN
ncbi:MAG: hypothetical protein CBE10_02320 [bacterium TMED250]|jgi:hypothetical protein|nr:MAG: hypothetical protein CBE10_02320 [bacterium TMED250]|tara:strand:+ start:3384 stop:4061 length:678 start_codon:yes stop_codon:yes gene_type:complete